MRWIVLYVALLVVLVATVATASAQAQNVKTFKASGLQARAQ